MPHRGNYMNPNGNKTDRHKLKNDWKYRNMEKLSKRKETMLSDGNPINNLYSMDVTNTLGTNTQGLDTNRKNTKLALRKSLSMVPRDEVAGAIIEGNFSMVPMETLPTPIKPKQIMLAA